MDVHAYTELSSILCTSSPCFPQKKELFLLQMHLASMPGLQKSDSDMVEEFKLIFEVS